MGSDAQTRNVRAVQNGHAGVPEHENYSVHVETLPIDHDDFGLNQSKIMNVIDSKSLERDAGGKPVSTFPHPVLRRLART
jgi:hypothetical protein